MIRYGKTPWGVELKSFSERYGIPLKAIAKKNDISYNTLRSMSIGRCTGEKNGAKDKVDAFIKEYVKNADPLPMRHPHIYIS